MAEVIDKRLTPKEREWAIGWAEHILTKLGVPEEERAKIIEAKKEMLVEWARRWRTRLLEALKA